MYLRSRSASSQPSGAAADSCAAGPTHFHHFTVTDPQNQGKENKQSEHQRESDGKMLKSSTCHCFRQPDHSGGPLCTPQWKSCGAGVLVLGLHAR